MEITELLIIGYNGDEGVFAVNLAPDVTTMALTGSDDGQECVVESVTRQAASPVFFDVWKALQQLPIVPVQA